MSLVAAASIALTVSTPDDTDEEYEALWSEIDLSFPLLLCPTLISDY
jgi:hypothetical protein